MPTYPLLTIYTDGGARGNPGPAAIGFSVVSPTGEKIHQHGQYIGHATNNTAEYQAVIHSLNWLKNSAYLHPKLTVNFYLDSNLVVNQLSNNYKIKQPHLLRLYQQIKHLETLLRIQAHYTHIPREQNTTADSLLNQALNNHLQTHS